MSDRRARKKQQTRDHIVHRAEALFAERGLQEPTMEDLAAAADVAVATLYNYFGSKLALQMAVFESETVAIVAGGADAVADPGDDPEAAVQRLFAAYLDGFLRIDRRLLVDALCAGMGGDMMPGLASLDLMLLEQLGTLLRDFASRGLIAGDDGVEDAGFLLYSALITVIMFFLTVEGVGREEIHDQVRRLVSAAFRGLVES